MSRFDFDALDGVLDGDVEPTGTQTVALPKTPPTRPVAAHPPAAQRAAEAPTPVRAAAPPRPAQRRPWLLVGSAALAIGLAIGWTAGTRIPAKDGPVTVPLHHPAEQVEAHAATPSPTEVTPPPAAPLAKAEAPTTAPPTATAAPASVPSLTPPTVAPTAAVPPAAMPPKVAPAAPAPAAVAQARSATPAPSASTTRRWTIPFGFDSAAVTRASDIAAAAACPGQLEVVGHTDSSGARAYNDALSLRRATAIGAQLESAGVAHDRITLRGAGSTQPIAAGTSLQARKTNRRVEIRCAP